MYANSWPETWIGKESNGEQWVSIRDVWAARLCSYPPHTSTATAVAVAGIDLDSSDSKKSVQRNTVLAETSSGGVWTVDLAVGFTVMPRAAAEYSGDITLSFGTADDTDSFATGGTDGDGNAPLSPLGALPSRQPSLAPDEASTPTVSSHEHHTDDDAFSIMGWNPMHYRPVLFALIIALVVAVFAAVFCCDNSDRVATVTTTHTTEMLVGASVGSTGTVGTATSRSRSASSGGRYHSLSLNGDDDDEEHMLGGSMSISTTSTHGQTSSLEMAALNKASGAHGYPPTGSGYPFSARNRTNSNSSANGTGGSGATAGGYGSINGL